MVSTLDILPTILELINVTVKQEIDGQSLTPVLFQHKDSKLDDERVLFFWRDGFKEGPLPQPFGRYDVVAAKLGNIKAWIYTKSSHYNNDEEVYHDPPLLFDVLNDPAEAYPLDPIEYSEVSQKILRLIAEHKETIPHANPLTLARDAKYYPCVNPYNNCRTDKILRID